MTMTENKDVVKTNDGSIENTTNDQNNYPITSVPAADTFEAYKYPSLVDSRHSFMLTAWIPKEYVGRVIGRKGEVVSRLSKETHTNIYADAASTSKSLWTYLSISGEPGACQKVYHKIKAIVEDEVDGVVVEFAVNTG